jgi:arylsulfatase A-like enzyme
MNVLLVSIDSLRRDFLDTYRDRPLGFDYDVETPNLDSFADRAAVFNNHYAGSLPCMPARREWLTGVKEFLWRPWGPIEPFDSTIPERARNKGVMTKLITDHFHYFQHGSHGYYEDFNGFDFIRGQEYDAWKTAPRHPDERLLDQTLDRDTDPPDGTGFMNRSQYARNAGEFDDETDFFAPRVFSRASEWVRENENWDQWFCYVDSFDVHEPFHLPEEYARMYTDEDPDDSELNMWPYYGKVGEGQSQLTDRQLDFVRAQFAGKVTMTDKWFGSLMDTITEVNGWDDTVVIVTSDHGYMLGEHDWMAKNNGPVYDIIARTPLFIWHPESDRMGDHINALTTAVDLHETVLASMNLNGYSTPHSKSILPLLEGKRSDHRDFVLYGYWGTSVNVTDGQYTYLHPCDPEIDTECFSTTMMNPNGWFVPVTEKSEVTVNEGLPYANSNVWRFTGSSYAQHDEPLLFDTQSDPLQENNLVDEKPNVHSRMLNQLRTGLERLQAPASQYARLGLESP